MEENNKKKTWCLVIKLIIIMLIIILSALQIFGILRDYISINEILVGIMMLVQTIENWKTNKVLSYMSLFGAIFIFIVAISIML